MSASLSGINMVGKVEVSPNAYLDETIAMLNRCGLLLVSGEMGKANVMTIGWGLVGKLWRKPCFLVAVRPIRYTHRFIEDTGDFTVNVPKRGMEDIVDYCGTVSGRDHDKFKEKNLTTLPSGKVHSPMIAECTIHYECKVVYKSGVIPESLQEDIISTCYPRGDYHTLYFGEIVATYADGEINKDM